MTSSPSSPSSGVPQDEMGSERNRGMQCANPQCSKELLYLREGRLWLLELEPHADDQSRPDEGAFAMRALPSKFFWLCGECAKTHIVKRWTTSGPVVVVRNQNIADSHPDLTARPATTGRGGHFRCYCLGRRCGICSMGPFHLCCGELFLTQRQADPKDLNVLSEICGLRRARDNGTGVNMNDMKKPPGSEPRTWQ